MHRVELKDWIYSHVACYSLGFLMHRVELKVMGGNFGREIERRVPNAPCGVERAPS